MSFPATPLDVVVELYLNSTWVDISRWVRLTEDIVITYGKRSPLAATVPAECSLKLNNAGWRFVSGNAVGPYAGLLKRDTQLRVRVNPGSGLVTRFTGRVPAWAPRQDVSGNNKWVSITAHGVMYQLAAAGAATTGALQRYIVDLDATTNLIAYWSLEDGSDARSASSSVPGVAPLSVKGSVRFGSTAPLSGVTKMVDPSGGYLAASIPSPGYALEWRLEFVAVWEAAWSTNQRPISWLTPGSVAAWNVVVSSAGLHLDGFKTDVALVETQVVNIDTAFVPVPGQLHHIRIDTTMSGTTMQVRMYVDGTQYGSTASLLSSATLPPSHLRINPDSISTDDTPLMGHVAIWAPPPTSDTVTVALGRVGQMAHERIEEMCADAGVGYSPVLGATVTSEPMGPQPAGSFMPVLRDCEATDGGILYELTTGELSYKRRAALYNQTPVLELDYSAKQVGQPFEPTVDDAQLANDVTAKRPSGSEARYVDQEHVDAEGRHEDPGFTVNPEHDARLDNMAAFRARRGTVDSERYDSLSLNLAHPQQSGLIADWLAMTIGSRATVANTPGHPDLVDVLMVGYRETICRPRKWRVDMVCEPAAPYTVGVRGTARRNTAGSELAVANTSAQATDTSAARNYIVIPDVSAAGFAVGDRFVLHDEDGYRKEPTVFTVASKTSAFGFTNVFFTPDAAELTTGVFAGSGDTMRRVDQTSLLVATTLGPLWTTSAAQMPIDVGVSGERLTVSNIESTVRDTWSRTVAAGGLGTSDSGHAWSIPFGTASNFSANGSQGLISVSAINAEQHATVDLGVSDIQEVRLWLTLPVTPTGAGINWGALLRYVDSNNYVWADVQVGTDSSLTLRLIKRVAGTATQLVTAASGVTHSTSVPRILQAKVHGSTLYSKVWASDGTEPAWLLDTTDASLPAGTQVGVVARLMTGNTNVTPVQFRADNLAVVNPQTFTVVRAANGVEKAHSAGAKVGLWTPARRAL